MAAGGYDGVQYDHGKDHHRFGDKHHRHLDVVPHMEKSVDGRKCELSVHNFHHAQDVPVHRHDARKETQNYGDLHDGHQNRLGVSHGLVGLGVYS